MTPNMLQRENFDLTQVPAIFDVQVILEMLLLIIFWNALVQLWTIVELCLSENMDCVSNRRHECKM